MLYELPNTKKFASKYVTQDTTRMFFFLFLQKILTFSQLFHAELASTGTISIGLYRSVEASNNMDECLSCKNIYLEASGKIERFVYTLPEPTTPIYPNDMVSMRCAKFLYI